MLVQYFLKKQEQKKERKERNGRKKERRRQGGRQAREKKNEKRKGGSKDISVFSFLCIISIEVIKIWEEFLVIGKDIDALFPKEANSIKQRSIVSKSILNFELLLQKI